jgi:hypothetical protein
MEKSEAQDKENFLYPRRQYHGEFTPENFVFDANLQEFAQKVGYITSLETSGKLSSKDAYHQIKALWKLLKKSKQDLGIGDQPPKSEFP